MKAIAAILTLAVLWFAMNCASSRDTDASQQSEQPPTPGATPPAAIAQNFSYVDAVVDDIQDLGGQQFTLRIFIVSSTPPEGRTSILQAGQKIMVSPSFAADSTGKVNFEEPRNKRLLSLKQLTSGQGFQGTITINRYGTYNVVDVKE